MLTPDNARPAISGRADGFDPDVASEQRGQFGIALECSVPAASDLDGHHTAR
jgi:hypothetical protein